MASVSGILRPNESKAIFFQRLVDFALIVAAHALLLALRDEAWTARAMAATGAAVLVFLFAGDAFGLYQAWRGVPLKRELQQVWLAWGTVVGFMLLGAFALKTSSQYSRVVSFGWFITAPTFITLWRTAARLILQELRRRGRNTQTVAIVGLTDMGERIARRICTTPWLGMRLLGFFDDRAPERCHDVDPSVGNLAGSFDDVVERARRGEIDTVYVALPLKAEPRVNALIRKLADTTASVYVAPDFFAFDLLNGRWGSLGDIPVVSIFETPFHGPDGWLKRLEDIVLGTICVTIAALPMMAIASLIKLTSKGPVFFKQRRYGLNGQVIDVLKFRTMTVAEDGDEVKQATKGDQRITPLGALLRRTSLDELPQLLHVVTGSMSLVGPRPHAISHNELYRKRIHGYMLRHKVKPGLTGWAQVNGWRGETDTLEKMEKRIEHDLDYIRKWNIGFDLKIVLLTLFGSQVRKNAY